MILYSKYKGNIDVFKLEPKLEEIKAYREQILNSIKPKIYKHYSYEDLQPFSSSYANVQDYIFDESQINSKPNSYEFRNYLREDNNSNIDSFIAKYCERGYYNYDRVHIVNKHDSKEILHRFIITFPFYKDHAMEGIVDIPENIYLLHLLINGDFSKLVDEEVSEQLELFSLYHHDKIRESELKRGFDSLLIPGTYEDMLQKVEVTEKILKKII